jgi:hypothetical protein
MESKLIVSVVSGHVVIENEDGNSVFDIPCKSTVDATMLLSSLVGHSINMVDKTLYVKPSKKEKI